MYAVACGSSMVSALIIMWLYIYSTVAEHSLVTMITTARE